MKYQLFKDKKGEWRWRAVARNGRIVACSGESFHSKGNARRAVYGFHRLMYKAEIVQVRVSRGRRRVTETITLKIEEIK